MFGCTAEEAYSFALLRGMPVVVGTGDDMREGCLVKGPFALYGICERLIAEHTGPLWIRKPTSCELRE